MRFRALLLLPFLVWAPLPSVNAQGSDTLQVGVAIDRTLEPGQVHEFSVRVKEKSFVQLVVEQNGIDVIVKVLSPDGKMLAEFDTPNGTQGPERVSFLAPDEGQYRVAVAPLNKDDQTTGRYQIKLLETRDATEAEVESGKNRLEAKTKGLALLLQLREEISQIRSARTRINSSLAAAKLLREIDEKAAAKYLLDAVLDLKEMLAQAEADDDAEQSASHFIQITQLRTELIQALAESDPDAALNLLYSTKLRSGLNPNDMDVALQESALELSIVDQIARKDPGRALQMARQNLKKAYSMALLNTVSQLAEKNPEMATELVHDITTKLLAEDKLINNLNAATLAMALTSSFKGGIPAPVRTTTETGSSFTMTATVVQMDTRRLSKPLIDEQDYKQLLQKLIRETLAVNQRPGNLEDKSSAALWSIMSTLNSMGSEIDKVVSGSSAALAKKFKMYPGYGNMSSKLQDWQNVFSSDSLESGVEAAEKVPPEFREQMYIALANREAATGNLTRAKQIIEEHVQTPFLRQQALRGLEQQEIVHAMSSGKIEEALRNISALRTPQQRAEQLLQLAGQIGSGQKRETALALLEQARNLLPPSPQAQDQTQMWALVELARAFSPYDSKRSFEIVDPLIDQFNDICTAARTLQGFGVEFFEDDELDMNSEDAGLVMTADHISNILGSLALINFDRAKASTDKLRLPEVRLHVYLQIARESITGRQ